MFNLFLKISKRIGLICLKRKCVVPGYIHTSPPPPHPLERNGNSREVGGLKDQKQIDQKEHMKLNWELRNLHVVNLSTETSDSVFDAALC